MTPAEDLVFSIFSDGSPQRGYVCSEHLTERVTWRGRGCKLCAKRLNEFRHGRVQRRAQIRALKLAGGLPR